MENRLKPSWYLFDVKQLRVYRSDVNSNTLSFKADDGKKIYKYQNDKLNLIINENKYLSKVYNVVIKENTQEVVYWDYYNPIDVDVFKQSFYGTYNISIINIFNQNNKCFVKFELFNMTFNYVVPYELDLSIPYKYLLNNKGVLSFQ